MGGKLVGVAFVVVGFILLINGFKTVTG